MVPVLTAKRHAACPFVPAKYVYGQDKRPTVRKGRAHAAYLPLTIKKATIVFTLLSFSCLYPGVSVSGGKAIEMVTFVPCSCIQNERTMLLFASE